MTRQWLQERAGPLFLAAVAFALFAPFFFLGKVFIPGDFLNFLYPWKAGGDGSVYNLDQFDSAVLFHPLSEYLSERLHLGDIPLWDPNIFCGYPLVASGYGVLYPPRLLALWLFSAPVGMTLLWFVHILGMGLGMYGWLRSRELSAAASTLGGLCWMMNALNAAWVTQDLSLMAVYLAPMLWSFDQRRWGLLSIFGALCLSAGHVQMAFYLGWILAAYALARTVALREPKRLIGLGVAGIGVILLAAPSLWPFLELLKGSQREAFSWEVIDGFAAPVWSLVAGLFNPDLFGNPSRGFMLTRTDARYPFCEYADYFGLFPLALALLALVRARSSRWGAQEIRSWGAVGAVCLLFAAATPLYRLALLIFPVLARGLPGRFLMVLVFIGCVLAAHGLEVWREDAAVRRHVALFLGATSLVTLLGLGVVSWATVVKPEIAKAWLEVWITGGKIKVPAVVADGMVELCRRGVVENYLQNPQFLMTVLAGGLAIYLIRRPRTRVLLTFVAIDLLLFMSHFNAQTRPEQLLPKAPSLQYLQSQPGYFRIDKQAAGNYNTLVPYHLSLVTGYSGVIPGRFFRTISQAQSLPSLIRSIDLVRFDSPILSAMNLKYLLQGPFELPAPLGWPKVYDQEIRIFENPNVVPRVFALGKVRQFASFEQLLGLLGTPEFRPWSEVWVESALPGPVDEAASQSTCEISHYEPDRMVVAANFTAPGVLVLSESYYPGWRCVDAHGQEHAIFPVNGSSRGVYLPAGSHQLDFRFEPAPYRYGLRLSLFALLLALGFHYWQSRQSRTAPTPAH